MFGLSITLKEIFLLYSTQFVFSTIRFVSGNVVMVTIDMCWKSLIRGEWIYGITWKRYFNIFVLFIVDATSILKLVFPTVYVYVLMIILVAVLLPLLLLLLFLFLFIYLLIYLFCFFVYLFIYLPFILLLRLLFLILLSLLSPLLLLLLLE